jgi:L-fucose isomerase
MGIAGGVNTQFCCREGTVTLARLDRIAGRYVILLFKGYSEFIPPDNFTDTVKQWPHAFIRVDFNSRDLYPQLRSEHIHMVYGDFTREIEMICAMLDIEIIRPG